MATDSVIVMIELRVSKLLAKERQTNGELLRENQSTGRQDVIAAK